MQWFLRGLTGLLIIALLVIPLIPFQQQALWVRVIGYTGLYIVLGLGLNVILGFGGLLHLGFVTFYAIGAYTYAILASDLFGYHLSFWVVLPLAATLAAFTGILLGIPVLRTRGDYLAIITLGFGEITRILITNLRSLTKGSQGIIGIDDPVLFGVTFDSGTHYYYLIFAFAIFVIFITTRLSNSRVGRAWNAMREDEDVARMTGINTGHYKLLAFAVGGFIGGLAGVIFAAWQGSIFPDNFNLFVSINVLCLIIIGGVGSIPGVIVGALALIALPDILRQFSEYRLLIFGLLLVIMMILRPAGFLPSKRLQIELGQAREDPPPDNAASTTGGKAS
ncbi:MAG: ABC transporter ATP-binding protein [Anaerolineae bacterium]|nr:ABC transporter ATP-binding protein [Anaerolineae bacterium]